jgi:hypothetical protein
VRCTAKRTSFFIKKAGAFDDVVHPRLCVRKAGASATRVSASLQSRCPRPRPRPRPQSGVVRCGAVRCGAAGFRLF